MIVRAGRGILHLITQPDHAALARHVMERWAPLHNAPRRQSILLAVEEHDNGWLEPDRHPAVDPETGRIFDFTNAPAAVRQDVWPRGIARLAQQDSWAAALVAQHALTIYERYRTDAAWLHFFAAITAARDALTSESGRTAAELAGDYPFVRIGDLLSLIFCNEWREEQTFEGWRFRLDDGRVMVAPDPFAGRVVPLAVTARELPDRPYRSDTDLQDACRLAPRVTLHGVLTSGS